MIDRYSRSPMKDLWTKEAQFESWLVVELAVCEYYAKTGKIPPKDMKAIRERSRIDVDRIEEIEKTVRHDVIAFTTQLSEKIGPASRFVHLGLTSSDVVDTALALRMGKAGDLILGELKNIHQILGRIAREHAYTIMMGRTHGMHAEPTTFGLKVLVWYKEFERHIARFEGAMERIRVGAISGAVGTMAHTGPKLEEAVCKRLGLKPAPVSTQIIQRDRHAEFLTVLGLIGSSIEKIATEVRHLQRPEIRELEEPFSVGQKGSSAMPHKRNPVVAEQMSGLARVLRGNSIAAMENIALWNERDISHSSVERIIIPDSCMLADYLLGKLAWLLEGMRVNRDRMAENIWTTRGLVFSQRVLLRLVEGGLSREDAYAAVQGAAMRTWHGKEDFLEELLKEKPIAAHFSEKVLRTMMEPQDFLSFVPAIFERCGIKLKAEKKAAKTKRK